MIAFWMDSGQALLRTLAGVVVCWFGAAIQVREPWLVNGRFLNTCRGIGFSEVGALACGRGAVVVPQLNEDVESFYFFSPSQPHEVARVCW